MESKNSPIQLIKSLSGHLIIARPQMQDPMFERSVVYLCEHTTKGSMGVIINQQLGLLSFSELLKEFKIDNHSNESSDRVNIHIGGPLDSVRTFVLHTSDFTKKSTYKINETFSLSTSLEIFKAIAMGKGPRQCLVTLGYSGWEPGQLESEIQQNGWLIAPADEEIVFMPDISKKWEKAFSKIGVNIDTLSGYSGSA